MSSCTMALSGLAIYQKEDSNSLNTPEKSGMRSRSALEEFIGEAYEGFVTFGYFSANCYFAWNFDIKAQYCWAHLIRNIRFLL